MTKKVCDLLQRAAFFQEVSRAGVTERMRSSMLRLNAKPLYLFADDSSHGASVEGAIRKLQREKNTSAGAVWAPVAKIVEDRFAHLILNRELLDAASFGPADAESFVPPIKVAQAKARDLTYTQTVNGKQ